MSTEIEQRVSSQLKRVVADGQTIYEKCYVTNDWDTDLQVIRRRATDEVALLRQIDLSDLFGNRLGVVQIAAADPSDGKIATFEVPGRTLDEIIVHEASERKKLLPWFLAGRWLRQFQQLPMLRDAASFETNRDPVQMRDYCELRLKSLVELGYGWPRASEREAILRTVESLQDCIPSDEFCSVWVHADFSPGNLLWDGHSLTPIDFAMVSGGHPLADATYLIHRVEMHRIYRPWLKLPVSAVRNAVLRGIGMPNAVDSAAYRLLMIKHHICRIHTYARRPARNIRQAWHDRWVRTVLRRNLGQLCDV